MIHQRTSVSRGVTGGAGRRALLALAVVSSSVLASLTPQAARADSLEGAFLKAHYAALQNDLVSAAKFYRSAIRFDRTEPRILKPAFYYSLLVGEIHAAENLAPDVMRVSSDDRLARLTMVASALRNKQNDAAAALLNSPETQRSMLPMTHRLLQAWAAFGKGDHSEAEEILNAPPPSALLAAPRSPREGEAESAFDSGADRIEAVNNLFRLYGQMHLGLMAAARGDDEHAVKAFQAARDVTGGWPAGVALDAAGAMRRLGRNEDAAAVYESILIRDPLRPAFVAAKASMERGERPEPAVVTAADGAATALYGMGVSLRREREESDIAVYYLQLARLLKPDFHEARFAAAAELAELNQLALAAELYAGVPPHDPLGELARLGRAEALVRASDLDGARAVLQRLAAEGSVRPGVYLTLGVVENASKSFNACATAFEKALTLMERPNWRALLQLGVCREQQGDWPSAEAAFVEALALEPRQADVLNHFGYGLVEQGRRLDEARSMLEVAVEERPDNGYIVDSLGWALFRQGDFEGAVQQLEKAVSLAPSEAVINDHFGDALWRVGRRLEARFQWRRALSFDPSEEEKFLIQRKIEIGLDRALAEEANQDAAPKKVEVQEPGSNAASSQDDG